MNFKYSASNLPEISLITNKDPLCCLATHLKDPAIRLTKEDELKLFEHIPSKDLYDLINASSLSLLEKEYMYYHHHLKYLSPQHMKRLIDLNILPSRLKQVKLPPCLAYLLGKSQKKPWRSKAPPPTIRGAASKPGTAMSVDQLVSTTSGLKS